MPEVEKKGESRVLRFLRGRKSRLLTLTIVAIMMVTLVGAGCGKSSKDTGVLKIAQTYDMKGLDPINLPSVTESQIAGNIYDGLLQFEYGGTKLQPALATEWTISPDGKTYTFKLRKGVQFHKDYGEMTSADVKFSLDRVRDKKISQAASNFASIDSIDTPDASTVVLKLNRTDPALLTALAAPTGGIVSKKAVEKLGKDYSINPVGTGPFAFEAWKANTETDLVANKKYWGSAPKIQKLVFVPIPEPTTMYMAFEKGEVDVIQVTDGEHYKKYKGDAKFQVSEIAGLITRMIGFNQQIKPFDNPKVRQAVVMGFNRDKVINEMFGNISTKAKGFLAPSVPGYEPNQEDPPYDPVKAKQLLTEAGFPDGFKTVMEVPNIDRFTVPATVFQEDMRKLGITIEYKPIDTATALANQRKGSVPIWSVSWNQDPVPDRVMMRFHSSQYPGNNGFGYKNPAVDKLIDEALASSDDKVRSADFSKIQQQIAKDYVGIWLDNEKYIFALSKKVKGFPADPRRSLRMFPVSIDPNAK